jgi:hypothetical protein
MLSGDKEYQKPKNLAISIYAQIFSQRKRWLDLIIQLMKYFAGKIFVNKKMLQIPYSELKSLRVTLVHETTRIRATGIRTFRRLLKDEQDVAALIRLRIPYLVAR